MNSRSVDASDCSWSRWSLGRHNASSVLLPDGTVLATGGTSRGAACGVTNTWHAIIYDHEVLAPAMPGRRLLIYDDGVVKLFDSSSSPNPIGSGRLDASAMAS
jgi:hypothetical protein